MAFPSSPTQGQEHTENGQVWQYKFPSWRYRRRAPSAAFDPATAYPGFVTVAGLDAAVAALVADDESDTHAAVVAAVE
jgi:hypothetical protein